MYVVRCGLTRETTQWCQLFFFVFITLESVNEKQLGKSRTFLSSQIYEAQNTRVDLNLSEAIAVEDVGTCNLY